MQYHSQVKREISSWRHVANDVLFVNRTSCSYDIWDSHVTQREMFIGLGFKCLRLWREPSLGVPRQLNYNVLCVMLKLQSTFSLIIISKYLGKLS